MASCQGKSEILSPPDPGGWGSNSPGPSRIRTPSLRSAFTLSLNGALSESRVYKGQGHDGDIKARRFGENAQSISYCSGTLAL